MASELAGDELTFVAEAPELVAIVTRAAYAQGLAAPADCDRWKRLVRQPRAAPRGLHIRGAPCVRHHECHTNASCW